MHSDDHHDSLILVQDIINSRPITPLAHNFKNTKVNAHIEGPTSTGPMKWLAPVTLKYQLFLLSQAV